MENSLGIVNRHACLHGFIALHAIKSLRWSASVKTVSNADVACSTNAPEHSHWPTGSERHPLHWEDHSAQWSSLSWFVDTVAKSLLRIHSEYLRQCKLRFCPSELKHGLHPCILWPQDSSSAAMGGHTEMNLSNYSSEWCCFVHPQPFRSKSRRRTDIQQSIKQISYHVFTIFKGNRLVQHLLHTDIEKQKSIATAIWLTAQVSMKTESRRVEVRDNVIRVVEVLFDGRAAGSQIPVSGGSSQHLTLLKGLGSWIEKTRRWRLQSGALNGSRSALLE